MTMLDGVTIFDKAKNEETFKDGDDYTYLSYTLQKSAEFLLSTKMIDEIPDDLSSIWMIPTLRGQNNDSN